MIKNISDFKYYLESDLRSMGVKINLISCLMDPVIRFVFLLRLCEYLRNTNKAKIIQYPVLFWFRTLSIKLGFSITPNIFGPGLAIVHYGLLILDPTTRIGKNCRIHMGVHIGGAATFVDPSRQSEYSPRIGDNVYIGPGAKIYGPVKIGNNCVIGANAVVTKSFVEDGLTIAGVPAKIIARNGNGERVIKGAFEI
jgi:serine O-acetyltransferase